MNFRNPVIPGFHPDPSVCRVGSNYYLVTSSFEYFPGVPIFHSTDLVHWTQVGYCLTRDSQLPLKSAQSSGGIYAPTIRWHDGRFYMVVTNVSGMGHFYVTSEHAEGPWSEPIVIAGVDGIDPSLFFDDDGTVYFSCTSGTGTIDIETGKLTSELRHIWTGSGGRYAEAPHLYKIGGIYYLMLAEGGTEPGHMVTIARSKNPWGPYEACPHNPILTHRDRGGYPIQSTGHADLIESHDGSWWAVFLATRVSAKYPNVHHLGRETFLAPVQWDAEGWPVIGNGGMVDLEMPAPTYMVDVESKPREVVRDDFDSASLALPWNFRRNPNPDDWSLSERPGSLALRCSPVTLNDIAPPAFVGRRQEHFNCRFSASIDFDPVEASDEAGLVAIMNEEHHYEIFVRPGGSGQRLVAVRRRIGDLIAVVAEEQIEAVAVVLWIEAVAEEYRFGYETLDGVRKELASGSTRYLSTEVAGGFTGLYLGMYATSNPTPTLPLPRGESQRQSSTRAYFDWAEYKFDA